MPIFLLILIALTTSCVTNSFKAKQVRRNYKLSEFSGVYVPHGRLSASQEQVLGSRIVISDFVPKGVADRLKATYQKIENTSPGITIEIFRGNDESTLAESVSRYYYLGVNRGPIDLVHFDFDEERNAFERTSTVHELDTISHKKSVLIYLKGDTEKKTSEAGLSTEYNFRLNGQVLTVSRLITKLTKPWTTVFPPGQGEQEGVVTATYMRVEQPRFDARFRLHRAVDHRR